MRGRNLHYEQQSTPVSVRTAVGLSQGIITYVSNIALMGEYSTLGENGDPCDGDDRRYLREFEVIYAVDIDGDEVLTASSG